MGTVGPEHSDYFEPDSSSENNRIFNLRGKPGKPPASVRPPLTSTPGAFVQALPMVLLLAIVAAFVAAAIVRSYQ